MNNEASTNDSGSQVQAIFKADVRTIFLVAAIVALAIVFAIVSNGMLNQIAVLKDRTATLKETETKVTIAGEKIAAMEDVVFHKGFYKLLGDNDE